MNPSTGRRGSFRSAVAVLALAGAFGSIGCAGDYGGMPRTAVQVYSINGNEPLMSDLAESDNTVATDIVEVRFLGSSTSGLVDGSDAYDTITMNHYSIDFLGNDLDGDGVEDLHDVTNEPMNTVVPVGGMTSGSVVVVPAPWKTDPNGALSEAAQTGNYFSTTATITFYGEEETSHDVVTAQAVLEVMLANFVN